MAALGDRATRPITVIRGYALESWIAAGHARPVLQLLGRDRGDARLLRGRRRRGRAARGAHHRRHARRRLARDEGVPVIGVPAGMQPRAAVVYMTMGALECAALCGAAPALHAEIDTAAALLEQLVEEWGPGAARTRSRSASRAALARHDPRDPRRRRARSPWGGAGARRSTRTRSRRPSGASCPRRTTTRSAAGSAAARWRRFSGVFLGDPDQHPRVKQRIELMSAEVERTGAPAVQVEARGESRLERVLSLVLLGDLVSVYMAVLAGRRPHAGRGDRALQSSSEASSHLTPTRQRAPSPAQP